MKVYIVHHRLYGVSGVYLDELKALCAAKKIQGKEGHLHDKHLAAWVEEHKVIK